MSFDVTFNGGDRGFAAFDDTGQDIAANIDDNTQIIDVTFTSSDAEFMTQMESRSPPFCADMQADGKDGVSCTHEWNGTILTVTSASGTSSADLQGPEGKPGAVISEETPEPYSNGLYPLWFSPDGTASGENPILRVFDTAQGKYIGIAAIQGEPGKGFDYEIGNGLKLNDNVLSVDTVDAATESDTRPITSQGVYNEFAVINALLKSI